jgi:hypothetical protein
MNTQYGGLGYDNVYDVLKQTLNVFQKDNKFDPKSQIKTCASAQNKLNCQSGKILKYFMRAELENYKTALKKDPNADKLKYLNIVKLINGVYKIDTEYLKNLFDLVKNHSKTLTSIFESSELLINIDRDTIQVALLKIIYTTAISNLVEQSVNIIPDLANIQKNISNENFTTNDAKKLDQINNIQQEFSKIMEQYDLIEKENNKELPEKSVKNQIVYFFKNINKNNIETSQFSQFKNLLKNIEHDATLISCQIFVVIVLSVWESRKFYVKKSYGNDVIPKNEFLKNLNMFVVNEKDTQNKYNIFNEDCVLVEFLNDLKTYLSNNNNNNIIDINTLCITNVDKECPIDEDQSYSKIYDEIYSKYKDQIDSISSSKQIVTTPPMGFSKGGAGELNAARQAAEQKRIDAKKAEENRKIQKKIDKQTQKQIESERKRLQKEKEKEEINKQKEQKTQNLLNQKNAEKNIKQLDKIDKNINNDIKNTIKERIHKKKEITKYIISKMIELFNSDLYTEEIQNP